MITVQLKGRLGAPYGPTTDGVYQGGTNTGLANGWYENNLPAKVPDGYWEDGWRYLLTSSVLNAYGSLHTYPAVVRNSTAQLSGSASVEAEMTQGFASNANLNSACSITSKFNTGFATKTAMGSQSSMESEVSNPWLTEYTKVSTPNDLYEGADPDLYVVNTAKSKLVFTQDPSYPTFLPVPSMRMNTLGQLTTFWGGNISLIDNDGGFIKTLNGPSYESPMAFTPSPNLLLYANGSSVRSLNTDTNTNTTLSSNAGVGAITRIAVGASHIAVANRTQNKFRLLNLSNGSLYRDYTIETNIVDICWRSDSQRLYVSAYESGSWGVLFVLNPANTTVTTARTYSGEYPIKSIASNTLLFVGKSAIKPTNQLLHYSIDSISFYTLTASGTTLMDMGEVPLPEGFTVTDFGVDPYNDVYITGYYSTISEYFYLYKLNKEGDILSTQQLEMSDFYGEVGNAPNYCEIFPNIALNPSLWVV